MNMDGNSNNKENKTHFGSNSHMNMDSNEEEVALEYLEKRGSQLVGVFVGWIGSVSPNFLSQSDIVGR